MLETFAHISYNQQYLRGARRSRNKRIMLETFAHISYNQQYLRGGGDQEIKE